MQSDAPGLSWLTALAPGGGPLYLQIVDSLANAIAAGRLQAGDRLAPQRAVASRLGVDLTTVTRAYAEARTRGLLAADGPRGSFVAARKVELQALVDLSLNIPPPPTDPDLQELLRNGLSQVLLRADVDLLMTYHLPGGSAADRLAGARWLRPMLGELAPERVAASPGSQAALSALILADTAPGDVLLCEPLVYPGFRAAAAQLGRRVMDVAIDDDGMRPDALEAAVRASGARVVYLNPTIQNPTTVTMPERRRRAIATLATRLDLRIIEDDPYWLLADAAPPPLARLAPERVHYVATLSKCLSPGLRTAFVASPDRERQGAFLAALRAFSLMRAPLTAVLATQWLEDGTAQRLLAGVREEARARQALAAQSLAGSLAHANMSREGIHLWLELPSYWTAADFARASRAQGLAITPSDAFASGPSPVNAIRISLGEGRDRKRLSHALARLSGLLVKPPSPESVLV